jgi:hypothetical protein
LGNLVVFGALLAYAITRGAESGVDLRQGSVGSQVGDLLLFATLCGLLAYATVELVKRLTGLRGFVNSAVVQAWLEDQYDTLQQQEPERARLIEEDPSRYAQLLLRPRSPFVLLARALGTRDLPAIFDLPPERLVAQISTAIDVALFQPEIYGPLLTVVARLPLRPPNVPADRETELLGSHEAQQLRLSLDDLQTMLTRSWRRIVQSGAVWIAGAYGVLTTFAGGLSGTDQARYLLATLILGGPISWTIRDLTAVLGRMRQ